MKITVFAAGSRGDIQPCIVLCQGLRKQGYTVSLAAPADFAGFAHSHSVNFQPLRGDVQKIMESETGKKFMDSGGTNPFKSIFAIRKMIRPIIGEMTADLLTVCRESDALICLGVQGAFGQAVGEALKIPVMNLEPTPLLPTRAFPAPSWPFQRSRGKWLNHLSGLAMLAVVWLWYKPYVNDFRRRLGLGSCSFNWFYRALRSSPLLGAYSSGLIPHPSDWPETTRITGYLYLDSLADWQPSRELTDFLEDGEPPVYIGFGSMNGRNPEELADLVLKALKKSGQRGILMKGWGGLSPGSVPGNVFVAESVPHSWLFPRMAAVVHHGGAGTTAEGIRAGVPAVIVPFAFDQAFWGERIHARGIGPEPIPRKKLTADSLARAITRAVTDTSMKRQAQILGENVRKEAGLENAVKYIKEFLGEPV